MRYDDWDVILFPRDSHIPIQEFKTACFVSPDEYGRQLPNLTCYIRSLPPATPFRISVHSWATVPKTSAFIESLRKSDESVVYTIQLVVDGAMVFRNIYELACKWPQEIVQEKRTFASTEQSTSQRNLCLEFPPFHQQTLMQSSWDARESVGRIKLVLSEQLISKTSIPRQPDFGATNDIVCFSFQHAPSDLLEQAGISWPIRNLLYLPQIQNYASRQSITSPLTMSSLKMSCPTFGINAQSPLSPPFQPTIFKPHSHEPHHRPHSHVLSASQASNALISTMAYDPMGIDENSFVSLDSDDDASPEPFSKKRSIFNSANELAKLNPLYKPFPPRQSGPPPNAIGRNEQNTRVHRQRVSSKKDQKKAVTALGEDQLGQYMEADSPPPKHRKLPYGSGSYLHQHGSRFYQTPTTGTNNWPSSASARSPSYPGFSNMLRNTSNRLMADRRSASDPLKDQAPGSHHALYSSNKENCSPSQFRLPTPFPQANRVPTPNPFASRQLAFSTDVAMRDPSSMHFRPIYAEDGPIGSSYAVPILGTTKSKEENKAISSPKFPDLNTHHDKRHLPPLGTYMTPKDQNKHAHTPSSRIPAPVEVIDVDAIDAILSTPTSPPSNEAAITTTNTTVLSPTKQQNQIQTHKQGMSSMDSTSRIEQQLFTALGDELASFDAQLTAGTRGGPDMGEMNDSTMLVDDAATDGFEAVVGKRKRACLVDLSPVGTKSGGGDAQERGVGSE